MEKPNAWAIQIDLKVQPFRAIHKFFFCHILRHHDVRGGGGGGGVSVGCDAILQHDRGRSGRAVHCVLEHSMKVESTLPVVVGHCFCYHLLSCFSPLCPGSKLIL